MKKGKSVPDSCKGASDLQRYYICVDRTDDRDATLGGYLFNKFKLIHAACNLFFASEQDPAGNSLGRQLNTEIILNRMSQLS